MLPCWSKNHSSLRHRHHRLINLTRGISNGSLDADTQDRLLSKLNEKVKEVYKHCIGDNEVNIDSLQMLTNIENKLENLFETIDLMPAEKVEQAERVCLSNYLSVDSHFASPLDQRSRTSTESTRGEDGAATIGARRPCATCPGARKGSGYQEVRQADYVSIQFDAEKNEEEGGEYAKGLGGYFIWLICS